MNLMNLVTWSKSIGIDIFSGVRLPEGLDPERVKSAIMIRSGLLTPIYAEPEVFEQMTAYWFESHQWNFAHLLKMIQAEYSPIENVDRYDETLTTHTGTERTQGTGKNTNSGSDSVHSESSGDTTSDVSAFNASDYVPDRKSESADSSDVQTDYGLVVDSESDSTLTHDTQERFTQHLHGNVGVTSNVKLLTEEKELISAFNPYTWIAEQFEKEFLLMVY